MQDSSNFKFPLVLHYFDSSGGKGSRKTDCPWPLDPLTLDSLGPLHCAEQCKRSCRQPHAGSGFCRNRSRFQVARLVRNRNLDFLGAVGIGIECYCADWITGSRHKPQLVDLICGGGRQAANIEEPSFLLLIPENSSPSLHIGPLPCQIDYTNPRGGEHCEGIPMLSQLNLELSDSAVQFVGQLTQF